MSLSSAPSPAHSLHLLTPLFIVQKQNEAKRLEKEKAKAAKAAAAPKTAKKAAVKSFDEDDTVDPTAYRYVSRALLFYLKSLLKFLRIYIES